MVTRTSIGKTVNGFNQVHMSAPSTRIGVERFPSIESHDLAGMRALLECSFGIEIFSFLFSP